ncbi:MULTISPECIES: helix-turn-helix domain-containing protein [Aerococcus]|uniref:helix-turn-helix domain-containing protein n=2 Tax=Bacillati TaxID=1783272 RepID=UPI000DCB9682|nr:MULTISPECIES: helix-turn-helix domain-containing protein [Aerococcus]MDL5183590.1 helix-turn-helix domain-containing protein [Aerococcus mictus]MDK6291409.1 helix-turn-helix domain-containing protein [Aerococcus urinae]MDK6372418.1 helix-turn-helix domain-containing protein [Aerococcus urinae]MDK6375849.1 helix-turn-helix domain-containing protein [Aerococcus urinae]MDK6421027.1 helix-turn-helix domain-containing protein [Aerococcus urinae]
MSDIQIQLDPSASKDFVNQLKPYLNQLAEDLKRDLAINKEMLTIDEVTQLYSTSRNTVTEKWHRELGLPLNKLGNKVYVERSVLNDFIRAHPYQ